MRSEIVRGHSINANIFGLARVACERMGGRGKEKVQIEEREGREEVKKQKEGLRKRGRRQKGEVERVRDGRNRVWGGKGEGMMGTGRRVE